MRDHYDTRRTHLCNCGRPATWSIVENEMGAEQKARLSEIVSVDSGLMHGLPCFRGTRVPVRLLLDDLKSGYTIDEFLAGCPTVSRGLVEAYLKLAEDLVAECAVA